MSSGSQDVVAEGADLGGIFVPNDAAVNARGYSWRAAERVDVAQQCLLTRSSLQRGSHRNAYSRLHCAS
jgi:hypothetical protein